MTSAKLQESIVAFTDLARKLKKETSSEEIAYDLRPKLSIVVFTTNWQQDEVCQAVIGQLLSDFEDKLPKVIQTKT